MSITETLTAAAESAAPVFAQDAARLAVWEGRMTPAEYRALGY